MSANQEVNLPNYNPITSFPLPNQFDIISSLSTNPNVGPATQPSAATSTQQADPTASLLEKISGLEAKLSELSAPKQSNSGLEDQISRLVSAMEQKQQTPAVDYMSMSGDQLLQMMIGQDPDPETGVQGQAPKVKEILMAVAQQAQNSVKSELGSTIELLKAQQEAVLKQHNMAQAQIAYQRLETEYQSKDPFYKDNLKEAQAYLQTPIGQALIEQDPQGCLKSAYEQVAAKRLLGTDFATALANKMKEFQGTQSFDFTGGVANAHMPRSVVNQPNQGVPQVPSDLDVINQVMRASGINSPFIT